MAAHRMALRFSARLTGHFRGLARSSEIFLRTDVSVCFSLWAACFFDVDRVRSTVFLAAKAAFLWVLRSFAFLLAFTFNEQNPRVPKAIRACIRCRSYRHPKLIRHVIERRSCGSSSAFSIFVT
jgi:hypothetical protein